MAQTITRAIKMYVVDVDQNDREMYAERLKIAVDTAQDRVRRDTPF